MLYFLDKPVPRNNTDYSEMARVDEFKKSYASMGIYSSYSANRVLDHLYQTVTRRGNHSAIEATASFSEQVISSKENSLDIEKFILDDILTDNEILLLAFSIQTGTRHFGEGWQAEETKINIKKWIEANELFDSNLLTNYSEVIVNLADRGFLNATDFTSYGNAKRYSLSIENHNKLRKLSTRANDVLTTTMKRYYFELPF